MISSVLSLLEALIDGWIFGFIARLLLMGFCFGVTFSWSWKFYEALKKFLKILLALFFADYFLFKFGMKSKEEALAMNPCPLEKIKEIWIKIYIPQSWVETDTFLYPHSKVFLSVSIFVFRTSIEAQLSLILTWLVFYTELQCRTDFTGILKNLLLRKRIEFLQKYSAVSANCEYLKVIGENILHVENIAKYLNVVDSLLHLSWIVRLSCFPDIS